MPPAMFLAVRDAIEARGIVISDVSEIRLRRGMQISLSLDRVNMRVPRVCEASDMEYVISRLCRGSVYAYEHHLREGYVPVGGGMRVAVNTAVHYSDGKMLREHVPLSLVFRIPVHTEGQSKRLAALMHRSPGGMLMFSPPAVGKTTVLRDLVMGLSGRELSLRVAVIDCRGEIDDGMIPESCLVDFISGCERASGMEWALRTLSPQIIAVDELVETDMTAVCNAARCGVPVVATLHGGSFAEVLSRKNVFDGFASGAFSYLVGITRERGAPPEFEIRRYSEGRWTEC